MMMVMIVVMVVMMMMIMMMMMVMMVVMIIIIMIMIVVLDLATKHDFILNYLSVMLALFDNYYREVGAPEDETSSERTENWNFINSICNTRPMELVYQFLLRKKIVCSLRNFKSKLYHIWFKLYPRRSGSIGRWAY